MHVADQDSNWESPFSPLPQDLPKPCSGLQETRTCNRRGRRLIASWLTIFHLIATHQGYEASVTRGKLYFRQNHCIQLQIDALKPSEREIKQVPIWGKHCTKALRLKAISISKSQHFTHTTENGATSPNILHLLHLDGQWPFAHQELTVD